MFCREKLYPPNMRPHFRDMEYNNDKLFYILSLIHLRDCKYTILNDFTRLMELKLTFLKNCSESYIRALDAEKIDFPCKRIEK